jgi:hypothetical protein
MDIVILEMHTAFKNRDAETFDRCFMASRAAKMCASLVYQLLFAAIEGRCLYAGQFGVISTGY